jgi:hypothetical protein
MALEYASRARTILAAAFGARHPAILKALEIVHHLEQSRGANLAAASVMGEMLGIRRAQADASMRDPGLPDEYYNLAMVSGLYLGSNVCRLLWLTRRRGRGADAFRGRGHARGAGPHRGRARHGARVSGPRRPARRRVRR